jgi:hypothetical protein
MKYYGFTNKTMDCLGVIQLFWILHLDPQLMQIRAPASFPGTIKKENGHEPLALGFDVFANDLNRDAIPGRRLY